MRRISLSRRPAPFLSLAVFLFCSLLRVVIAHAQTSCLIYNFSDPHAPCSAHETSATAAVEAVIACDGPYFCGTSTDTLDSVDNDPAVAGQNFTVTVTYHASAGCGSSATAQGGGPITAASGSACPTPSYYARTKKASKPQCGCDASGQPVASVGDPINPAAGDVFETEDDVVVRGPGRLRLQRYYDSANSGAQDLGVGWRHTYSRTLRLMTGPGYVPYPPADPHSSLYTTQAAACTSGFPEIQSQEPTWATATVSWNGTTCAIQSGGVTIGTVAIASNVSTAPLGSIQEVDAIRDDGATLSFNSSTGGAFTTQPGTNYRLQQNAGGYALTAPDDTVEQYDSSGILQSVTYRGGDVQTLTYDGSSRLSTVSDSFGSRLVLGYDSQSRLISVNLQSGSPPASCLVYSYSYSTCSVSAASALSVMTGAFACLTSQFCGNSYDTVTGITSDPATPGQNFVVNVLYTASPGCGSNASGTGIGSILSGSGAHCSGSTAIQYGYDAQGRLTTVWYPDGNFRKFVYENATFKNTLTGVFDEAHNRLSSWTYDKQGRAVNAQMAGGADSVTLAYNSSTSVTETDAFGAVRTFNYSRVGDQYLPVSISGSRCPTCQQGAATTYDAAGFLSSSTDYNGNLTCYQNDPNRGLELARLEGLAPGSSCPADLSSYSPPGGTRQRLIQTQWDATWREPALITEINRTTAFTYDVAGNLLTRTITDTSVSPQVSRTWTFTYDSYGRVLTADGPRTDVSDLTTLSYYTCTSGFACGQIETRTDAAGHVTTFNAYNAYGQPLSITDPNGVITSLTYDPRQRLTSQVTSGETTSFAYYPTGQLQKVTLPDGSFVQYTYDTAHRLTQFADGLGNKIVYTVDALGNHTADKIYDPSNALHFTHTRVINTLSQVYQEVNAAGTAAVTTTFGYDGNGNPISAHAPLARNTTSVFDELNRVGQITDPASGTTDLDYDTDDHVVSVTDPRGLVTSYAYNGFQDLSAQSSPDSGNTTNTYDSAGNLATSTDARGAVSTYTYDVLNRASSVAFSIGGSTDQTLSFSYDAGTYGKGHLTGTADANQSQGWTYDALGRVTNQSQLIGGVTLATAYGYTSGNLTTLTTPSGQSVTYGYNANHHVTSISVNGTTVLNTITYEPLGPVEGWTWGNGSSASRTYDADGKITQVSSHGVKTVSYDDAFRITGLSDTSSGASNWTYGYDSLDRLTSGGNGTISRGWTYDANGNRQSETGSAPSTYSIASGSNRISSITGALARTYSYDAAGNTLTYSTVTATYNDRGRLETIANGSTTATFVYNALGQMIKTSGTLGTVLYSYDEAGHLSGEYDGSGALIEETVWLGDIPAATLRPNGASVAIYYVHTDQLNTPRQVTRPSDNAQMWTWFSDPFGTDAANENPSGAGTFKYNLRFPGQLFNGIAGIHQNYFRDFDPAIGRYVESDPIGLRGGISTYAYVGGNPVGNRDPFGLKIVVHGNATDYNTAIAYLGHDPGMTQIIHDLDNSSTVYNIQYINDGNDRYDPQTNTIYWDASSALLCTTGGKQTPALGLGHEMAHADANFWNRLIGWVPWPSYDDLEERRVITGPETNAAQTLREGVRPDHRGTPYTVQGPTAR
ncbi:MAG TPA: RHS repeat-associated core domain-containing protein [Steroidobacteraceae bacterium]|jgi:RHS repeat-associated protein